MGLLRTLTLLDLGLAQWAGMQNRGISVAADPFRLGSGAVDATPTDANPALGPLEEAKWLSLRGPPLNIKKKNSLPTPGKNQQPTAIWSRLRTPIGYSFWLLLPLTIMLMMPQLGGERNFNYRIPPSWSPESDQSYSFRAFMTDISLWIMLTDLQPHQQCAAIIMRLGGSAREMARMITPQEMMNGGMLNGQMVDAVTYLLGALHARFSALEEESRLTAMTEMLAFSRRHGESINALLARYEVVRQRAAVEGQFVMSTEGCALQLLRACGIQASHLFNLLQPFNGQLPQNDAQFQQLQAQLRRFGHL